MLKLLKWLVLVPIAAGGLLLHGRNPQPVVFDYYVDAVEQPLALLLALALLAGALLALLAGLLPMLALRSENRRLRRRLQAMQATAVKPISGPAR
jgi:uncharacterized integral membrane protein